MNAFQARLLSATSVQKEASSNAQVSLELETLRSRYTHIEEQNSDLKRENDQHQVHKLQLELELARLEQMAAGEGEDGVTIKVEHVATELNVSTTNIVTESTEDHAGSILRNTREANISKSNINAAREIYNVTMSGDTHMLQGKVLELSDEVKKMNEEREQLQKQIITLQEAAEDRSRRKVEFQLAVLAFSQLIIYDKDIFLAPSQNNKFQDLQSQGMSRREKILRKLLCLS
ncbi:hypothetical protein FA15DRAFT_710703 [Coprinopsis marcescibilis]|uniref:Uncharacterized protein n=1 Tax=Coprinopsis marcescibilis TaxID=230819 RepID=A0A5C3KC98_COPMA|nr:hypothetical protein FA15DRAFT_710703 [Coprinopsis marcescibilis]